MKFKRMFLPMLTFLFAISLAIAGNANFNNEMDQQQYDYADVNGTPYQIPALDCNEGESQCRARIVENGPSYDVYDDEALTIPVEGDGSVTDVF